MAYQSISTEQLPPYFATLLSEGVVSTGKFAFKLAPSGAELYLGGTDSSEYSGAITYTPVIQQSYWQVALEAVKVNSQTVSHGTSAIIDTGTTSIVASTAATEAFYAAYPGAQPLANFGYTDPKFAGYYGVPCSGTSVAFSRCISTERSADRSCGIAFGGVSYAISTSVFTSLGSIGPQNGVPYCVGGLIANDNIGIGSAWLVGDIFLQNVYSVFDLSNNQVGFATLK